MDVSRDDVLKNKDAIIDGLSEGQKLRLSREVERELALRDTFYLARHVLGYNLLNNYFHRALCRFHDVNLYQNQLHLHPRKHFKTTLITIAGKMRMVLIDPNITICINANILGNSASFLREIRAHYCTNEKFQYLFPEHIPSRKSQEGTTEYFTTPARTNKTIRMHTFEIASVDKAIVSRHYDLIMFDDIVDDKNVLTADLRQKIYDNYVTSLSVTSINKENLPWHHIVGTRWSFDDLYADLLDEEKKNPTFKIMISQAYWKEKDPETGSEYTKYLFPEKFPPEALDVLRRKQKDYKFSCLYLNNPVPEGDITLNPNDLQYFSENGDWLKRRQPFRYMMFVDPAATEKKRKGDPTAIGVFAADANSNFYIKELVRGWWNPDEIIEKIFALQQAYNLRKIGVEEVCFSKWLSFYMEKAKKDRAIRFQIVPIKRSRHSGKKDRHDSIQPFLKNGKIFARDDLEEIGQLKKEFREYPNGANDDFLDLMADAIAIMPLPAKNKLTRVPYHVPPQIYRSRRGFQTGYTYRAQ